MTLTNDARDLLDDALDEYPGYARCPWAKYKDALGELERNGLVVVLSIVDGVATFDAFSLASTMALHGVNDERG